MADSFSEKEPLISYKQLHSLDRGVYTYGGYRVTKDTQYFVIDLLDVSSKGGQQNTGWKAHVSIDPTPVNMEKAWNVFVLLAQQYEMGSFKFVNEANPGIGKQVTIYCDGEEMARLQLFLIGLNVGLTAAGIVPQAGEPPDCKQISPYIMIRNELFKELGASCVGGPNGYISDMHIDIAQRICPRVGMDIATGDSFDTAFDVAYAAVTTEQELKGSVGHKYIYICSKLSGNIEKLEAFKAKLRTDVKLIVEKAGSFGAGKIPWHNLGQTEDVFGLEVLRFPDVGATVSKTSLPEPSQQRGRRVAILPGTHAAEVHKGLASSALQETSTVSPARSIEDPPSFLPRFQGDRSEAPTMIEMVKDPSSSSAPPEPSPEAPKKKPGGGCCGGCAVQ